MASGSFLRSLPIIRIRKSNLVIADDPRKAGRGPWRQQGAKAFRAFNMVLNEVFADAAEEINLQLDVLDDGSPVLYGDRSVLFDVGSLLDDAATFRTGTQACKPRSGTPFAHSAGRSGSSVSAPSRPHRLGLDRHHNRRDNDGIGYDNGVDFLSILEHNTGNGCKLDDGNSASPNTGSRSIPDTSPTQQ